METSLNQALLRVVNEALSNLRRAGQEPDALVSSLLWKIAKRQASDGEIDTLRAKSSVASTANIRP